MRPVAALAACLMALSATPLRAAPGDITSIPAPVIGADPPKAKEIKDGDVSVSTQTGALTYSYPIAVPAGRLGMQPSLALAYSSQAPIYGGLAAGWSLSIPEIRRDTSTSWLLQTSPTPNDLSPWTRERFVSSLAGERPLVMVTEPTPKATDVLATYRAQNDTSFDRYERMPEGTPYRWRVRSHSGVTHYFGDVDLAPGANERWSPLTKTVDAYGNTVEYQWIGARISQIRYTSNPLVVPAQPEFAHVDFIWSPSPICAAGTAVGQVDDRRLGIVRGGNRLEMIRITAFAPGTPNPPLHTRQLALTYDYAAALCTAKHGPILQLHSIQETAWRDGQSPVSLPPVTFDYNRLERTFDQHVYQNIVWPPAADNGRGNLGWGTRDGEWPSVESMFLDFDGDGLQDRLYMVDRNECTFAWIKNHGAGADQWTATPSAPIPLPRLPWQNATGGSLGTRGPSEWCSLSGQYTEYVNTTLPACSQANTMLAYRWLDLNGDGLPELVTAIHSRGELDPNQQDFFGPWPACGPHDTASCLVPEAGCFADVTTCPWGSSFGTCSFDPAKLATCMATIPTASCDVVVGWESQPPASTCADGCATEHTCSPSDASCLAACQRRCSAGAIFRMPLQRTDPLCANPAPDPNHPDLTRCISLAIAPPTPPQGCDLTPRPQRRCGRYPWMIYDHLGEGVASLVPRIVYQPVPLESDSGDSSFGPTVAATNHGIFDIDGDGILDAVVRGRTYSESQTSSPPPFWGVFPGDGHGGFITTAAQPDPLYDLPAMYWWLTAQDAPVSASASSGPQDPPYHQTINNTDYFDNVGVSTVVELTGDGAPDYVWKTSIDELGLRPDAPRNVRPGEDATLRLFLGNGTKFEFNRPGQGDQTPITRSLNINPPYVSYLSRSLVDVDGNGVATGGMTQGRRANKARLVDIDDDGRPDIYHTVRRNPTEPVPDWGTPALYVNGGGAFLATDALPSTWQDPLKQESLAYLGSGLPGHTNGLYWETTRDLIDLDGDGLPEAWGNGPDGSGPTYTRDTNRQPLRLLKAIDNGRGGTTTITYAATTDAATVTQDAALHKALPHTQWVVASIATTDLWDAGDAATTSYAYTYPAWKPDDEGHWGFRGFEEVTTTLPSGARQVDSYGFDVDWSGRLKATKKFASEDPANPRTIHETSWMPLTLFGGAIKTFHPAAEYSWTCSNGQTELACKEADAGRTTTLPVWSPMDGQLWVATGESTMDGPDYDAGDRQTVEGFHLESNATTYRLQRESHYGFVAVDGVPAHDAWTNVTMDTYDDAWRHVEKHAQYFGTGAGPDLFNPAETTFEYDALGLKRTELRPLQQPDDPDLPNGLTRQYDYDATGRFATSLTNEVGQVVTAEYEPGTGAKLWSEGPNRVGTNVEKSWTDVDGLGRPLATYVNHDTGAGDWVKTRVSQTAYVDAVVNGARPSVVVQNLIDYDTTPRWTREETRLDSKGRPVEIRVKTATSAPYAVTTYHYDYRGDLVTVMVPDPSRAAGVANTVTYSYEYDSLGRPTSMVRPAISGAASGVTMSYDGLTTQSDEVAGGQGGPVARKVLINDHYGRLAEVREYTDLSGAGTPATTQYQYDAHDQVSRIENPDGVVTVLLHDYVGQRIQIDRAGRTWKYLYDHHGKLIREELPAPSSLLVEEYQTTSHYDAIDRLVSRDVGGRELSTDDKNLLGIGTVGYTYDTCTNGGGRLCVATMPDGRLTTTYAYDAEGNAISTTRQYNVGGVADTRVTSATFGPGGRVVEEVYPDHATGHPDDTTRSRIAYDDRALPATMSWLPATAPTGTPARVLAAQTRNVAGLVLTRSANLSGLGTGGPWRNFTSTWTYDKLTRVASQTVRDQFNTIDAAQSLTYHGLDDPHTLHHQLGTTSYDFTYDYDPRHQLTSVTEGGARFAASYGFTPGGKLAHAFVNATPEPGGAITNRDVTYAYGSAVDPEAPSALVQVGGVVGGGNELRSYSYDSVGNLKDRHEDGAVAATDSFIYDGDDQLRRSTKYSEASAITGYEEYYYDHAGQRFAVVTRDAQNVVTGVRLFLDNTEIEADPANGAVITAYAYLSMGTPVAKIVSPTGGWVASSSWPPAYNVAASLELLYHGLANNTLLSIRPNAVVQAAYIYGPYGEVIESAGSTAGLAAQRRRFNDKVQDDQTGLQYYGVRYFDGLMLGWTQADPLYRFAPDAAWTEPRKANLYQFVLGNPLRYVDPDGRTPALVIPAVAIGGAILLTAWAVKTAPERAAATGRALNAARDDVNAARDSVAGMFAAYAARQAANGAAWEALLTKVLDPPAPTTTTADKAVPDTLAPPAPDDPGCGPDKGPPGGDSPVTDPRVAKSIRSLEKQIASHQAKLDAFRSNPTTRPGMEGQPPSP